MDLELNFRRNFRDNIFSIFYYRRINFARATMVIVQAKEGKNN